MRKDPLELFGDLIREIIQSQKEAKEYYKKKNSEEK